MTAQQLIESPPGAALRSSSPDRGSHKQRPVAAAAIIGALTVLGFALRLRVAHQSLFADELSTYWIVATHNLGDVMSLMYGTYPKIPHAEITPPLFFMLSWASSQLGHAPELVRLPSLIAGTLTIPVVYLVGKRTVGRPAGMLAAAFVALSPFMIYYSAEARSYAVMMLLVSLSTLSMLRAIEERRARWWVAYAACSSLAFWTHYTSAFLLVVQLGWLLWAHPEARRPALIANAAAVLGVVPWAPGLINNIRSPTAKILSALSPFTPHDVRLDLEHWAIGFPYVEAGGLRRLPGTPALVLYAIAMVSVAAGLANGAVRAGLRRWLERFDRRAGLVFLLALSVPVGEAFESSFSTHLFGVRNLAASWPALALACAALVMAAGSRVRIAAAALTICAFALGASKMLSVRYARTDFRAAANFVAARAHPGDVVIDGTGFLSPGPLTGFDVTRHTRIPVFRGGAPAEHAHPFGIFDPVTPIPVAIQRAVATAHGRRIIVVAYTPPPGQPSAIGPIPTGYQLVEIRGYPDFVALNVYVWGKRG